jgi:hypothetical protein
VPDESQQADQPTPRVINIDEAQLRRKYKHATDFGLASNYNPANGELFKQKLIEHVMKPEVQQIRGTLRGVEVIHYYDGASNLNVTTTLAGDFLTGWKLSESQAEHLVAEGNLGGS